MPRLFVATAALLIAIWSSTATAAELIMVEEPGCPWCARWERELGHIYPKTPEGKFAPLRKVQLHDIRSSDEAAEMGLSLDYPVTFTPTFLLVEDGVELARLQGYPGEDFFWGLLQKMLIDTTEYTIVAPSAQ